ncbi:PREDICTED: cyclic nucleotide-binding domain-containing protein 1-like [Branchiostoma belcheri]|uniref:Cyclic nucleotide-binding domain-containing protein 1-like n=1 Tax=Branchiostoma belcheri TaxID=7741 RepID=A0A6P5A9E1_BRABE|nr:PREDICTED: cyclic nucleotide-binding domain-containing protein 1-like [Branchiostoma belcheri]
MQRSVLRLASSLLAQQKTPVFQKGQLASAFLVTNQKLSTTAAVHDGDRKLYELRTYSIRPDCFGDFLKLSDEKMHMRMEHSKLIGYWRTELGGINEVVHIWEYDNFSHRAAVRQALAADPEWVGKYFSKILPMLVKQENVVMHLMPWAEQRTPSKAGGVYELRSYQLTADQQWQDPLRRAVQAAEKAKLVPCELLGVYQSEFGEFNRVYQLWFNEGFPALDARQEARKKVVDHPDIIAAVPRETAKELIDYEQLSWLTSIPGLSDKYSPESSADAHRTFMENYHRMFLKPTPLSALVPSKTASARSSYSKGPEKSKHTSLMSVGSLTSQKVGKLAPLQETSHDIRVHLSKLHREQRRENPQQQRQACIRTLRKILRKMPFERSAREHHMVYKGLQLFSTLADQVSNEVLKEMATVAKLDVWRETGVPVFGNQGLHLVLKGSVRPQTLPYIKLLSQVAEFDCPTPIMEDITPELGVGDCFGTLERVEGRESNSRILTVLTQEPCEFLIIYGNDYKKVVEQLEHRDKSEKTQLVQACPVYQLWPRLAVGQLARIISWEQFDPNWVVVTEGSKAPFIAFIKSGECHVLREVEALHKLPNGQRVKKRKQVVVGRLKEFESFGEVSVLENVPFTCSVVTATPVTMGVITEEKLSELDDTTRQLLLQSAAPNFAHLSQDDIHDEYMSQEMKREWNEYKHGIVIESINALGIRPGYGKWKKS